MKTVNTQLCGKTVGGCNRGGLARVAHTHCYHPPTIATDCVGSPAMGVTHTIADACNGVCVYHAWDPLHIVGDV